MNILLCGASMGIGGAETHMLTLAIGLAERGNKVTVVAERGKLCEELKHHKIKFIRAPLSSDKITDMIKSYKVLWKLIERTDFDIVHAHSRISAFLIDRIRKKRQKSFKFVVTAHARYRTNRTLKLASVWGDECIAVSKDIKQHLIKNYGVFDRKISVVPNGVNTKKYFPSGSGEKCSVLFVSRLDRDCSAGAIGLCHIAPTLFEKFPKLKITVAGGGNDFKSVKLIADRANRIIGKDVITLTGYQSDIAPLIERHEYIVGVSRVALEAMAMKKSVILFGNEGALGRLTDENLEAAASSNFTCRGYKKNVSDEFLLSEIQKAFTTDEKKKRKIVADMREIVIKRYSHELMCDTILKIYERDSRREPKILIGGYYGRGNIGDERVLSALCRGLKRNIPDCRIRVIKGNGNDRGEVGRTDPVEIIKALSWSDVYVSGGGSLFQNFTSTRSLIYYCALIRLAKMMNNKVAVFANGIGPLKGKLAEKLAADALTRADYVSVRDMESFFKAISLTEGKILPQLSADPVFSVQGEGNRHKNVEKNKKSLMDFGGHYAVVALNGRMGKLNRTFSFAIKDYCSRCGMLPIFVSMDTKNDVRASREGAEICRGILFEESDINTLYDIISRSSIAIGARLHFVIFALCQGVKTVPINADPKINALSGELLSASAVNIGRLDTVYSINKKINCFLQANYKYDDAYEREKAIDGMKTRAIADIQRLSRVCDQTS